MKSALRGSALALVLLAAAPAAAQNAPDKARAEALFRDARALLNAGKVADACGKFHESQRLDPQNGTLLNLGVCHAKEGKTATAWAELREAAEAFDRAGDTQRARYARKQADALEPKLARVRIALPDSAANANAVVKLDKLPLGRSSWGTPLPVDPGEHRVEVSAEGKKPWSQAFTGVEASVIDVRVPDLEDGDARAEPVVPPPIPPQRETVVPPSPPPKETEPPPPVTTTTGAPILGYTLLGVGVVGIGVGTVFGLQTFSQKSDADALCRNGVCTPDGHALEEDARTSSVISTVGFGVGIVALAAGTYFTFFAKKSRTAVLVVPTRDGGRAEVRW